MPDAGKLAAVIDDIKKRYEVWGDASDVPRLLVAVDAVLELADALGSHGPARTTDNYSAGYCDAEAQIAKVLREDISRALAADDPAADHRAVSQDHSEGEPVTTSPAGDTSQGGEPCCRAINLEWYGCACDDECGCECRMCACVGYQPAATAAGREPIWTLTRSQLIDAIAGITVKGTALDGFRNPVVVADDMADAILSQLPAAPGRDTVIDAGFLSLPAGVQDAIAAEVGRDIKETPDA